MYETFYRLTSKPFQLSPDPGFYFASKVHKRAYAYLKYGVYEGEGFIVITGDIGAGKTTLQQTLVKELDSERIVAAQLVSTQIDADDLVRAVAGAFGLPVHDRSKAQLLAQFEAFLREVAATRRRALLIVDEAQNLTLAAMEELRMLSNFQLGARALLQSFLVGQPELRDILRGPSMTQLRQRIIASYHLGPMDRIETQAYVMHRLARAGWKGDPQIDDEIFDGLYTATRGVPRLINALCHRLLLGACLSEKHSIGKVEFAETIHEMHDELGPDPAIAGMAGSEVAAAAGAARGNGAAARPFLSSALVTRLERIERSVGSALDILQQLTGADAKAPASTAPKPRYRFGSRPQGGS